MADHPIIIINDVRGGGLPMHFVFSHSSDKASRTLHGPIPHYISVFSSHARLATRWKAGPLQPFHRPRPARLKREKEQASEHTGKEIPEKSTVIMRSALYTGDTYRFVMPSPGNPHVLPRCSCLPGPFPRLKPGSTRGRIALTVQIY